MRLRSTRCCVSGSASRRVTKAAGTAQAALTCSESSRVAMVCSQFGNSHQPQHRVARRGTWPMAAVREAMSRCVHHAAPLRRRCLPVTAPQPPTAARVELFQFHVDFCRTSTRCCSTNRSCRSRASMAQEALRITAWRRLTIPAWQGNGSSPLPITTLILDRQYLRAQIRRRESVSCRAWLGPGIAHRRHRGRVAHRACRGGAAVSRAVLVRARTARPRLHRPNPPSRLLTAHGWPDASRSSIERAGPLRRSLSR